MTPAGMVHALDEIHRLLKADGFLIDIHPAVDDLLMEVHQKGRVLYSISHPQESPDDYIHADKALAQARRKHKFTLQRKEQFYVFTYSASVSELIEYLDLANSFVEDVKTEAEIAEEARIFAPIEAIMNEAGEGAEVVTRESLGIARLNPVKVMKGFLHN